ncbi:YigZ family protein [Weizmannia acidilactici]|uniref:YigZ family protein n=1 Tax=Weizmannia acidilactici TaxID=2607726 RepID=A0A5J4JDW6_9BACI|nr:YigZ family protein [Weizmannia acidilactici]GER68396.1 YigZ family protein [Weizmannia acidilactici]GER68765.1 YigZ family protein [Weizmannia acidilactici]GER72950.1 YigZ family protein [Weizmannia acidilactici]
MLKEYFTVKGEGSHEIDIQKSRFIAHVKRAESEEEALAFVQAVKKEHWNATHNCSAYMIGEQNLIQKASDDGEPAGTAGVPMLEVLKKKDLKDAVVVVTRYFGGIKLGAGGLIRAYSKAASEGIRAAGIVKRTLVSTFHVKLDYSWLGKVENALHSSPYQIKEIQYLEQVELSIYVKEGEQDAFQNWMADLTNGQAAISEGEKQYLETDAE